MINSILAWFTDPANWQGEDGIPHRTLQHLEYTAMAVLLAAVIAIPLGLWVGHTGRLRWLVSSNAVSSSSAPSRCRRSRRSR